MNEKLSFQNITDALAQKSGVSKKVADAFCKSFFDTVVDAFSQGEDVVKVKGLGAFKLVTVDSRESVNVSNGERIVIPGYKKIAFTPEDSVVDFLNKGADAEQAPSLLESDPLEVKSVKSSLILTEEDVEEKYVVADLIQVPEPERVETPQDSFAGIDMLISTPESVEEIRQQYQEAKAKMDAAVEEARKANAEKLRLEKLLERMEQNMEPECAGVPVADVEALDESEKGTPEAETNADEVEEKKRLEALNRVISVPQAIDEGEKKEESAPSKKSGGAKWFWIVAFILLLLSAIVYFLHKTYLSIDSVKDVEPVTKVESKAATAKKAARPKKKSVVRDTLRANTDTLKAVVSGEVKADTVKNAEPEVRAERPATHIMKRGETLTRISVRYYGTKDSVRAIIRANKFADPDNVHVGAEVKLP